MAKINLNKLAKTISEKEGKKESVSIAQIKEILKITLDELSEEWYFNNNEAGVIELLRKRNLF